MQTYAGEQNHYNIYIQYYNTCTSNCFTDGFKVSRPMFIFLSCYCCFFLFVYSLAEIDRPQCAIKKYHKNYE